MNPLSNKKQGERVKAVRLAQKSSNPQRKAMTQEEFAALLSIEPNYLSMIERGARSLPERQARKIADLFPPTRFQYLMGYDDFPTELELQAYHVLKPRFERQKRKKAVEALFNSIELSIKPNTVNSDLEMDLSSFVILPKDQRQSAIDDFFSLRDRPDGVSVVLKGSVIGHCSQAEYDALIEEIFSFVEFKIERLCKEED